MIASGKLLSSESTGDQRRLWAVSGLVDVLTLLGLLQRAKCRSKAQLVVVFACAVRRPAARFFAFHKA